MADINVTYVLRDDKMLLAPVSVAASQDKTIAWDSKDESTVMLVTVASGTANVTVKAGNGVQGVQAQTFECRTGTTAISLNSGRFMNTYGANVGNVVINSTAACTVSVVSVQGYGDDNDPTIYPR